MKVQLIRENGGPEVFETSEMERPEPNAGEVLVKVAAASVNTADLMARSMGPVLDFIPAPPAILGMDFAGTVGAVGEGVTGFAPGDEVYGCAGGVAQHQGTFAEYLAADARLIAKKPKSLSMAEAASLPLVAITTWEALFDRMDLSADQSILIHGGAGGVGHVAVQLAKAVGAKVYATAKGPDKIAAVAELGAEVIDYSQETPADYVTRITGGTGFDLVFDTVGGANIPAALEGVKLMGQIATTVSIGEVDLTMAHLKGATLHVIYMLIPMIHGVGNARHGEILAELAELADAGKIKPLVDTVYPLEKAAEAHARLESKATIGKVVVQIAA